MQAFENSIVVTEWLWRNR